MSDNRQTEVGNTPASVFAVFKTFLKLGLTSFGGPVAHLGYFRKELIEKQAWVSESQFSQLLAIAQFLPGPASSQLGFSLGLLRAGWLGALVAFLAFTLPSALLLVGFASALPYLSSTVGEAIIHGLKLVAFSVVADAVWSMSQKLCPDTVRRVIALAATVVLLLFSSAWSQLLVVIAGAVTGIFFCRVSTNNTKDQINVLYGNMLGLTLFSVFMVLLALATLAPTLFASEQTGLQAIAIDFYRTGALVFGGGHVVLPLLQDAVVTTGLVSKDSFLAGYGASQAIPGPMFTFSAYLGAIIPGNNQISWLSAGTALIMIFLPGFLLISAALPLWQRVAHLPTAAKAITGVNAAVVGLLAAALYDPIFTSSVMDIVDLFVGLIGVAMLIRLRLSPLLVVAWCVFASVLVTL